MIADNPPRSGLLETLAPAAVALAAIAATNWTTGIWFWLWLGIAVIAMCVLLGIGASALLPKSAGDRLGAFFPKLAVIVASLTLAIMAAEGFLALREKGGAAATIARRTRNTPEARLEVAKQHGVAIRPEALAEIRKREGVLTMPDAWQMKERNIEGSARSFDWHGYLHVLSQEGFRRATPFPEKKNDTFRIMFVGDSMTYGYGVDERFIYATLIGEELNTTHRVEVINLGISGWQSADILKILTDFMPRLQPDLVVYGMVLNDFLPSGIGQYSNQGYKVPIPAWLEAYFNRGRVARLTSDAYGAALRSLGLRNDFYDDILKDFDGYQSRFGRDVEAMNRLVTSAGLPPIIAMVLDQYPVSAGRGARIARDAERHMKAAGMNLVSIEEYLRRYDGYGFPVSLWEGHGDELAHAIWASMLLPAISAEPGLQKYRRQAVADAR